MMITLAFYFVSFFCVCVDLDSLCNGQWTYFIVLLHMFVVAYICQWNLFVILEINLLHLLLVESICTLMFSRCFGIMVF